MPGLWFVKFAQYIFKRVCNGFVPFFFIVSAVCSQFPCVLLGSTACQSCYSHYVSCKSTIEQHQTELRKKLVFHKLKPQYGYFGLPFLNKGKYELNERAPPLELAPAKMFKSALCFIF